MSDMDRVITSCYFASTTLSTVGFGDYYPVSDEERLVGSFFLLFGVAIFSYFMGELCEMIIKLQGLDDDFEE
jgi:voltage-gated potassium channel